MKSGRPGETMIRHYYILYCAFTESYVYEERENCWQFTGQDTATKFKSKEEAQKIKTELEAEGFPQLTIFKMEQTTEIVDVIQ